MTAVFMPIHGGYDYVIFLPVVAILVVVRSYFFMLFLPGIILVAFLFEIMIVIHQLTNLFIPFIMIGSLGAIYLTLIITTMIFWSTWFESRRWYLVSAKHINNI